MNLRQPYNQQGLALDLEYQKWGYGQDPKLQGAKKTVQSGVLDDISAVDVQRKVDAGEAIKTIFGLMQPIKGQARASTSATYQSFMEAVTALEAQSPVGVGLYIARRWTSRVAEQHLMQKQPELAVSVMKPISLDEGIDKDSQVNFQAWNWETPHAALVMPLEADEARLGEEELEQPNDLDSAAYFQWAKDHAWRQDVQDIGGFLYEAFACEGFFYAHRTEGYFEAFVAYSRGWSEAPTSFDEASGLKACSAVMDAMQNIHDATAAILAIYNDDKAATPETINAYQQGFGNKKKRPRSQQELESTAFWTRLCGGLRMSERWTKREK